MLKVILEGSACLLLDLCRLTGKMSQIRLLEVAGHRSWTSLGPLGVGSSLSQAAVYLVNWSNLLCRG